MDAVEGKRPADVNDPASGVEVCRFQPEQLAATQALREGHHE